MYVSSPPFTQMQSGPIQTGQISAQSAQNTGSRGAVDFQLSVTGSNEIDDPIAQIFSEYDMSNISPREIDDLFNRLVKADYPISSDLLMLSTHGEGFRSHISEMFGGEFDPNQRSDLFKTMRVQLQFAKQAGDPIEAIEQFIYFLGQFGPQKGDAPPSQYAHTAQSIVTNQMNT